MSTTTNYSWTKPTVGGDNNAWGTELNTDLDGIDTTLKAVSDVANAALPKAGGTMTGALTNASGFVGPLTGNATTATTAATANAVAAGSVTPAGLSTGHPTWNTNGDFFPFNADAVFGFVKDPGNGMHRLYWEANSFIEFNTFSHQVIFVISGTQVGHVDPVTGFTTP